ncbi:MAG TPA: NAD(P)/FAD-dependent oxidoreductase [Burkholderiales bacterium]|nr:NAD(P)/FAD-dependent oxidoreductase [Burkholderiales bacterium]
MSTPHGGPYDALIIGAGHNGLTCACYLAAAGLRVRVLERRHIVGGAAVTEEFHPGFRNSIASYTVSLLNPKVIRDLHLAKHGLRIVERPFSNFLPLDDNSYLRVGGGLEATQAEVARFSQRDAERLPAYYASIERVAAVLRDTVLQTPPNVGGGLVDLWRALKLGNSLRGLDIETQRDLHALFTKSAGDILDTWFESAPIKAALGFDAIVGNYASPYTPGSAYVLLHHCFGEVNGKRGIWGHAIGGMGAITQAMAAEAKARGVEITTSCAVERVLVRNGRAVGVLLQDGTSIAAQRIVSNLNPKLLFEKLVEPEVLDIDFRRRIAGWKCGSGTLRMNVALKELPDFSCLPGKAAQPHHSSGIIMAPSLQYMDRAYRDAQEFGWSRQPIVEMLIPSTVDDSLAPSGMHVASLFCQQFSPEADWDTHREQAADLVIDTVNRYAPNFKSAVIAKQVLTPLDLERTFGLIGGDIFHGALSLDQLFSARPVLGHADYRSPIAALYLCGSGTHPGGGVTGAPGHNAAQEIIKDWRSKK